MDQDSMDELARRIAEGIAQAIRDYAARYNVSDQEAAKAMFGQSAESTAEAEIEDALQQPGAKVWTLPTPTATWLTNADAMSSALECIEQVSRLRQQGHASQAEADRLLSGFCDCVRSADPTLLIPRLSKKYRLNDDGLIALTCVLLSASGISYVDYSMMGVTLIACGLDTSRQLRLRRKIQRHAGVGKLVVVIQDRLHPNAALLQEVHPAPWQVDWEGMRAAVTDLPERA